MTPEDLSGEVALVTGASRGIGRAIAVALHAAGAHVIAAARASEDLARLGDKLRERITCLAVDVRGDEILKTVDGLARLDIIVNNAGVNRPKPIGEVDDATLDEMLDLNVRAAYRICRHGVARMTRGGRIINITSQMGHVGSPNRTVYCMTKHALEGLTKALAVELAPSGIRVNSVAPTFVETPLTAPMLADPGFREFVRGMIPLGEIASADDVARAVLYLCGQGGRMITGHSLVVDGGWTAQ